MRRILAIPIIFFLFLAVSAEASEPTQQYNKIYLNPFYRNSMTSGTNYTYTIDVSPPDHISSVISAIVSMEVWMTPSINFTILVNGKQCNTINYYISTTYASAGSARVNFDCSNIITQEGNYSITIKPTLANTGSSTAWLELTYMNKPFGEMKMMGTEYQVGDYATVFLQLKDSSGYAVNNGNCYLDVYYPNQPNLTHQIWLTNAPMVYLNNSDGIYYYDVGYLPNITGVYMLSATCSYTFSDLWAFGAGDSRKSNRTVIQGTYYGDTISLNTFEDGIYTECASGGGKTCEAYYDFNLSDINITGCSSVDLFYSGEATAKPTTTFYVWNWTSGSWITLPNTLTFSGLASVSSPSGVNDFVSNTFCTNDTVSNTSTIRIRLYTQHTATFTKYDNWLSLRLLLPEGNIQELKGSGEIHITNHTVNINPEQVWNYPNRTLTDYNQTGIFNFLQSINDTQNLHYTSLYNLIVSVNTSINQNIDSVNATLYSLISATNSSIINKLDELNATILAVNQSIWGKLFTIQGELQDINNNLTLIYGLIGMVNSTIMNKLFLIQDEITSVNNTIKEINASIHQRLDSIDAKLLSIEGNITELKTITQEINMTTHNIVSLLDNLSIKIDNLNASLISYINTSLTSLENNLMAAIISVNNTVISSNGTIMQKLYMIQDEIADLNNTLINGLLNISNITVNITMAQDEIIGAMIAFGGDTTAKKSYAYLGMMSLVGLGLGEDNAMWACKDNVTLVKYATKYIGGSLNKTYVMADEQICTYGCVKNACVLPAYQIWIYVFIGLIAVFLLYLYFSRHTETGEAGIF